MPIGPLEILIVVLIVVLVWRGPKMLPQFGEALGKAVRGARDNFNRDSADTPTSDTKDDDSDTIGSKPG